MSNARQLDLMRYYADHLAEHAIDDFATICEVPKPVNAYTVAVAYVMAGLELIFAHSPEEEVQTSIQNLGLFVNQRTQKYIDEMKEKGPQPAEVEGHEVKLN